MSISRSINETSYPGGYTPKQQILKAFSEGLFDEASASTEPRVAVSESEANYKVVFTAPGLERENLLVSINESGNLCIFCIKHRIHEFGDARVRKSKAAGDTVMKEVPLPDYVDPGFTSATCHGGILTIFFTKSDVPVKKRPSTIVVY